jgi:hypothetical protein
MHYYVTSLHGVNMNNQEKLLKQIKSLSDSIRQKSRALKMGINEREQFLESTFKPVTDPLKKLVQTSKQPTTQFEGDNILPISKYEDMFPKHEETEGSEESEESEDFQVLDRGEGVKEGIKTEESSKEEGSEEEGREEEVTTNPSNLSKLGMDIKFKGKLGRKYLLKMLHSTQANRNYHKYGARIEDNGLMVGDSELDIDQNDDIIVGGERYKGTTGLFELIFKDKPGKHTKRDLQLFKDILEKTNAHKKGYAKNLPIYRNNSIKYISIISNLFPSKIRKRQIKRRALSSAEINILHKKRRTTDPSTSGKGLLKNLYKTNIIYYNDVNKLVDRMRLIHEAMEAGHTGLDNEWIALVDELRTRGIIVY